MREPLLDGDDLKRTRIAYVDALIRILGKSGGVGESDIQLMERIERLLPLLENPAAAALEEGDVASTGCGSP